MGKNQSQGGVCGCGCGALTRRDARGVPMRFVQGHNRRGAGWGWVERGYRYANVNGVKTAEHRWVIERMLGRKLGPDEIVHHIDGNGLNNDPDNLIVLSRAEHMRLHALQPRRRWTEEERGRAVEMRAAGMSNGQIAKTMGHTLSSTEYQFKRLRRIGGA